LVDKGNTVLIIEHNMDVIKVADYLVDLGPEGGNAGGYIVAAGTPEAVAKVKASLTAPFLLAELAGSSVAQPDAVASLAHKTKRGGKDSLDGKPTRTRKLTKGEQELQASIARTDAADAAKTAPKTAAKTAKKPKAKKEK